MRRTFLDYYKEYGEGQIEYHGQDTFSSYVAMFLNWTECNGYIEGKYSQCTYSFSSDTLHTRNIVLSKEEEAVKTAKILKDIHYEGYRSEIYKENKELLQSKEELFEISFCDAFLRILFPKANFNSDLIKTNPQEICSRFLKVLPGHYMSNRSYLIDHYIDDLQLFLTHIPTYGINETFGFYCIENLSHAFTDISVLIYSKDNLSDRVFLYQIGDNN